MSSASRSRSRVYSRPLRWGVATAATLAMAGAWELLARGGVLPDTIPALTSVLSWLGRQLTTSAFWASLGQTVWHWAAGLVLGVVVGTAIGLLTGTVPVLHRLLQGPSEFLRPIPPIVYLPIFILVMGSTSKMAIVLVAIGTVWPMLFQSYYGVVSVDQTAIDTGRAFGLSRRQRLLRIILPSTLPYIATGVRIASALALVIAIAVELIGGVAGLGADLTTYSTNAVYVGIYGTLFIAGVLGMLLNLILEQLDRRLLSWHVPNRTVSR